MAPKETQDASKETKEVKDESSVDLSTLFTDSQDEKDTSEKADVKKEDTLSSEESEEPDVDELKSQLGALTKELNRIRKGKAESSAEVQDLREQLANVQGQLEVMAKGTSSGDTKEGKLAKYTDEQLIQGQTEWEDEIYEARDAMRRARTDNDDTAYSKASREASVARTTLNAIRKELLERTKRVGAEQAKAQAESSELVQEVVGLYDQAYEAFPELKDKESEIWQAGNEVYKSHSKLMKQLGPLAEIVAIAVALTGNPKLVSSKEGKKVDKEVKEARKELLSEINERAEKALIKGGGTTNKKTIPDFASMPNAQFDALVHKIKMG